MFSDILIEDEHLKIHFCCVNRYCNAGSWAKFYRPLPPPLGGPSRSHTVVMPHTRLHEMLGPVVNASASELEWLQPGHGHGLR